MADLDLLKGATIAFDLDGTLVDSAPDLIGTLNVLLAAEGLAPLPVSEARPFIGRGARWLIERGFTAAGATLDPARTDALFTRFIDHYNAHIADESRPFPGVVEALSDMKAAGAKLVVCTNKLTGLSVTLLDALNLSPLFEAVVGADSVSAIKPNPAHLIEAVAQVGGDIRRAIMVGDAATDAGAARGAGTPLVLVSFGYTEIPAAELSPDALIDSFDDLPAACLRLLSACPPAASEL